MNIKAQNKQMFQNYHFVANKMSIKSRYKALCKLYTKYKVCINVALENTPENPIADDMMISLEKLLNKIEKFPIPWKFYNKQSHKFSQEFEDLIIFTDEISIY